MKLYDYYRSTACYRVRIALNYKNIPYETIPIHLINNNGEQHHPDYLAINPQALVPSLETNGKILTQSLAILDYLEETHPKPALLPEEPLDRARVKSLALSIACDIHPLNNLRVLQTLRNEFQATEEQVKKWYHHWLKSGFNALESQLQVLSRSMDVCYGNAITIADLCLIPQVYNAQRFEFSLDDYPLIQSIYRHCVKLDAFKKAAPESVCHS